MTGYLPGPTCQLVAGWAGELDAKGGGTCTQALWPVNSTGSRDVDTLRLRNIYRSIYKSCATVPRGLDIFPAYALVELVQDSAHLQQTG